MSRANLSVSGFIFASVILSIGLLTPVARAQTAVQLDPFDWATPRLSITAQDTQAANVASKEALMSRSISTIGPALGGETDGVLTLVNYATGQTANVEAHAQSGLHIEAPSGLVQFTLSLDGRDGAPNTLHASDGFDPAVDFTANGTLNSITLHATNNGPAASAALVTFSSATDYSLYQVDFPAGSDADYQVPFEDFTPSGQGADMTAITAFVFFFGVNGGAPGPVDFCVQDLGLGWKPAEPSTSTEDIVIMNQFNAPFLREVWANDFGANAEYMKFSTSVAEDFEIGPGDWNLVSGKLGGTYFQNKPADPSMDVVIYPDDSGRPGASAVANYTLSLTGFDPFTFQFPVDGPQLPQGKYWISYALNAIPGFDGFFLGSGQVYGDDAQIRNPGGGLGCGSDWTAAGNCESGVRALKAELVAHTAPQPQGDVAVDKVTPDTLVAIGDTLTFTITVTNNGNIESLGTVIEDFFDGAELVSLMPSQGTCDESSDIVIGDVKVVGCKLGLLSAGASATVEAKMVATRNGWHRNTVHFVRESFPDSDASNDWADVLFNVDQRLTVTKTAPPDRYLAGQTMPFTIVVKNESSSSVSGVELVDSYHGGGFTYVHDDAGCAEPAPRHFGIYDIRCDLGSFGPFEERTIVIDMAAGPGVDPENAAYSQQPAGLNRVEAFSDEGFEDRDEFSVDLRSEYPLGGLLFWAQVTGPQTQKRSDDAIDVYLNNALLADDISPQQAIIFHDVPADRYPFYLYLVPSDAPDRSSAFDSIRVELSGVEEGLGSGIVLTLDEDGDNHAVVLDDARNAASNPDGVDVAVIHAAPGLPPLDVTLMTEPEPTVVAGNFEFGQTSAYTEIETPGTYNLIVAPSGSVDEAEVFSLALDAPGEAYMVVIAPGTSAGKLEGIVVYAIDYEGNVVEPAVVTSTDGTDPELPDSFALHGNYPNPFNPTTTIGYDVPETSDVKIAVYDALGRMVDALRTSRQVPGAYTVTWNAQFMPSGVYFVRMEAGSFVETRKMVLTK